MKKTLLLCALVLLLVLAAFAGCTGEEEKKGPLTITDQMGNAYTFSTAPEKIVSLAPSLTEIIVELELASSLVGCDEASKSITGAEELPQVMTWQGLDLEAVVALEPDIVFMDKTLDMSGDTFSALDSADITAFVFFPKDLEDVLDQIDGIGQICGAEDKAGELRSRLDERIDAVETASSGYSTTPKVLYITYYDGLSDPWVGTDSTMSGGLISSAGGKNVIGDSTGFGIQISLETVLAENPDIILTSQSTSWPTQSRKLILGDDRLKDVSAVKNSKVFDIDGDIMDRPGPGMVDGLEEIHGHISDLVNE